LNIAEHRWTEKRVPYEESIRVPIIVRYDPATQLTASTDQQFVLNLDFAQTFANLADTSAPGAQGASVLPLLAGDSTGWRTDFLIEHWENTVQVPAYCAVRNQQYLYVEYQTGEQELYDLKTDPYELTNLASDPTQASTLSTLHGRMVQLCSPPPPGSRRSGEPQTQPSLTVRGGRPMWPFGRCGVAFRWATLERPAAILANPGTVKRRSQE
jgi:arylsulfatase A-like enzyme